MKQLLWLGFTMSFFVSTAQESKVDPRAVMIMDKMAAVIGELQSCSFSLSASNDVNKYPYGMITQFTENQVQMLGSNKMLIHSRGDELYKGFWYNGEEVVYYSYTENNYAVMQAPKSILQTIDSIHSSYGVDFPAADFFYPTFTDDVLAHFDDVQYVGQKTIGGQECFHIKASNSEMIVQFWIADDAMNFPVKFLIVYTAKEGNPQYEATFSDWEINPVLPEAIFEFSPPPGARKIEILAKNNN